MDFFQAHNARAAAQDLIECDLRDQATGEPITNDGEPCIVLVKSTMSDEVLTSDRAARSAAIAGMMKKARKGEAAESTDTDFDWDEIEVKINARAVELIGGFKNMHTQGQNGKMRKLTVKDAAAFVALNRISEEHYWRNVIPLSQNDDETEEQFEERKAEILGAWLGASFAQQVIDAANEHAETAGKPEAA